MVMTSVHSAKYKRLLRRLLAARLASGLTQAEVARRFHRPQSFVSKCESGERRIDALELGEFAEIYGRPLGYFVAETDEVPSGVGLLAERPAARRRTGGRTTPSRRRRRPRPRTAP
jgi:transcriptional regulator with XRE-family HTH domain